jgi:2,3-bisphosphoglycerate-dependent phosphoglycerate mutase
MPESYHAIIRHGAYHQREGAPSARQPYALTDEGVAQARACGDALAAMIAEHGLQLAPVIHCSHQLRAWQTAAEIADRLRAHGHEITEIHETGALAERGLGSAANLTVAEIEAVLQDDPRHEVPPAGWKSDSDYCLPLEGAESLVMAGARVAGHLLESAGAEAGAGRLTVHVGHGASFRHAAHHLGLLEKEDLAKLSMFHARALLLCYRGHDSWSRFAGAWKVRTPKEDPID